MLRQDLRSTDHWIARCFAASTVGLPLLLVAGNTLAFNGRVEPSISDFYYTGMRPALVIGLCTMAVLLIAFRWQTIAQRFLSFVVSACLSTLALCPIDRYEWSSGTPHNLVHYAAATTVSLVIITMVSGAGSANDRSASPRYRIVLRIQRATVIAMLLGFVVAVADLVLGTTAADSTLQFWLESAGLIVFGVWFVFEFHLTSIRRNKRPISAKTHVDATAAA